MEEKVAAWEAEQLEANSSCLREMRTLIPPDILQSSVTSMMEDGLPKTIANRVWSKRVLWLLRMHPDDIKKIHIADLRSKYSNQGLDIVGTFYHKSVFVRMSRNASDIFMLASGI